MVPWAGVQCVILVFPHHTHLLFMVPLWFNGDCMPKLLIDNDDLFNSEESYNDYEEGFAINVK